MSPATLTTWIPRQHGAWAMLAVPWVVGFVVGGPHWRGALLLLAWLAGYLAFVALGKWIGGPQSRRARWQPPILVFGGVAVVAGGSLLALEPGLAWWAPWFVVLLGISLGCSARHAERSWLNDVATLAAACSLTVVAVGAGALAPGLNPSAPLGPLGVRPWIAAAIVFGYFLGTVFYVKTMIRDRGRISTYAASVGYHLVVAGLGWWLSPLVGAVGLLLLARAAVLPKRWPTLQPIVIGIGEYVASIIVTVTVLLWF